jgi:hypothetical protein
MVRKFLKNVRKIKKNLLFSDDVSNESMEELRARLNAMKKLVADRQNNTNLNPGKNQIFH